MRSVAARRVRRTAVLATVAFTGLASLAGCALTTTTSTATLPGMPTTTASPGPVSSGTPAPLPPTSRAPALANTGTSWPAVLGSMITYGQWLEANPNPALATTITEPGCASANALTATLQSLVEDRSYVQPSPPALSSIIGPSPQASGSPAGYAASLGGQVTIDVQAVRAAEPVLARTTPSTTAARGSAVGVLDSKAVLPPTNLRITMVLGSDHHWRFCGVADVVNDPDGETLTTLL